MSNLLSALPVPNSVSSIIGTPQSLFNRDWSVTLSEIIQTGTDQYGNPKYKQSGFGNKYTGLRVTFDFTKTSEGQSNKGKVEVWNLNPESRKRFQKGALLTLRAGYVNLIHPILIADILSSGVHIRREGSNIVTSFECGSSERQIETAIITKSYPPGTAFNAIMLDCANAMNVGLAIAADVQNTVFNQAISLNTSVKNALYKFAEKQGLSWNIQDDELQIYPKSKHTGEEAIVLMSGLDKYSRPTQNTGLIGVPSKADGGKTLFTALMNPNIKPGRLVQLVSENVNGFFKIMTANFKGDSHGSDWQIDCESYEVKNVQTLTNIFLTQGRGVIA